MKVTVFLLNAFISQSGGGNPAGVVLDADQLTAEQKKHIAAEIGFSETAFVQTSKSADFKVTFFTPTEEVDICAHATIATYTLLFRQDRIEAKHYLQEIKAGTLPVEVRTDGSIFMDQVVPIYSEVIPVNTVAEALQIEPSAISNTGLSAQIVSTGSRNITIPVINREVLFKIRPNVKKLIELNKTTNTNGYKVFTFDTVSPNATAHSRDFAPAIGIPEESATGITTGALACYLYKYNKLKNKDLHNLIFEQGYSMDKPSLILTALTDKQGDIIRVQVGGKAELFGKKEISVSFA